MAKQKGSTRNGTDWMGEGYPFRTLPDYLQPGLDLVFVGINPGLYSVQRGHYFARLTSRFWPAFSASKLSERVRRALGTDTLRAEHDAELPRFGIGLTDVVKRPSANAADLNAGDVLTAQNLRAIRPGLGLPPQHLQTLLGKRVNRSIRRGTAMSWDFVG